MRQTSIRAVTLALLLVLTGCAAKTTQTGLVTSGQALIGVGNTFVAVGATYTANCTPTVKNQKLVAFCEGFKTYAPRFQKAYRPAVDAWEVARKANDASKAQQATAVILQLSTDLTALALQIIAAQGGN
jgi:hypothetical protein